MQILYNSYINNLVNKFKSLFGVDNTAMSQQALNKTS
jgi:hypothetical protein